MERTGTQRRLAAVVSADIAGYSRLMGADEEGVLAALKAHRNELIEPKIAEHNGRLVKTTGDGLLAEFGSVVNAVRCAIDIQEQMRQRNSVVPEDRRIEFRIGINLGDIIIDDGDVYGDGVNVAARLQEIAEPGGVCISANVYEYAAGRVGSRFKDDGERHLKNIARPVRVWRWAPDLADSPAVLPGDGRPLPLADKPSIAVLPFDNMSGDPEQDYFADGISEDIITELSRFRSLTVIARNSTFAYKGRAVNVREVGADLNVQYVLEGSVRKAGNRVRITAQLIDTATGKHLWADRFDRDLDDVFAVQDEITERIVATLPSRLEAADLERAKRKTPDNLAAYDYLLRGKDHHHRGTRDDNALALRLLDKATELDPDYGQAYAWKACTLGQGIVRGYLDPDAAFPRVIDAVQRALSLDDEDHECHRVLTHVYLIQRQYERAEFHQARALALNPNDPRIVSDQGELLIWLGRPEEGIPWLEKAIRLDPYRPDGRLSNLGVALHAARHYPEAVATFKRIANLQCEHHAYLAACYAQMGRQREAMAHAAEVRRLKPDFSTESYLQNLPYKNESDREHHREGLRKAGLAR